jgi:hydrogenase maturation protein HypF
MNLNGMHILVSGIVQGVGFRPFIYNLAQRYHLSGWVKNMSAGIEIEVYGGDPDLQAFSAAIMEQAPPLSRIEKIKITKRPPRRSHSGTGYGKFEILHSESIPAAFQPVSSDIALCPDCLREMLDPKNRRYRYPFINCANCGPRFTIIREIPYDRSGTTMSSFEMCPECAAEYQNPASRRFHAPPVACPNCGPKVWLEQYRQTEKGGTTLIMQIGDEAIQRTRQLLAEGKIVAIKGLGGFHLACNAKNPQAVAELRRRKLGVDRPFAVMMPDYETVKRHCHVHDAERVLLESSAHPIVLLRRRSISMIAREIAPGQRTIGVMLPDTPLHHLLLEKEKGYPEVLVMTSGNLAEEPICTDNIEARERLADLAEAFLLHDRDIHLRTDDSVVRVFNKKTYPICRSRGYAPFPVRLPWEVPPLLAVGAELNNTFCITNGNYAFLSHRIGNLENLETLKSFEQGVEHFERLFKLQPQAMVHDLYPGCLATRYALERADREKILAIGVQHHHAHIAALMAERGLDGLRPVIGVAFDGAGYGEDGTFWGGEFLIADYAEYKRAAHLTPFLLPGGQAAARRPSQTALGLLYSLGLNWNNALPTHEDLCYEDRTLLRSQLEHGIDSPLTSSVGRLFDAAAALAGVRQKVNYESQAAIEFEALVDPDERGAYLFEVQDGLVNPKPAFEALIADALSGVSANRISSKFHNGLARMVTEVCRKLSDQHDLSEVVLSGGVWQNMVLLAKTVQLLEKNGFTVHFHQQVPANDGGLALGQAAVAAYRLNTRG